MNNRERAGEGEREEDGEGEEEGEGGGKGRLDSTQRGPHRPTGTRRTPSDLFIRTLERNIDHII